MAELTDQEIQEMIQKARDGDAEANYRMSEWALEQAMAEPEEERWNRLAARCLVKAAEAGYEPAQERMEHLFHQIEEDEERERALEREQAQQSFDDAPAAEDETEEAPPRPERRPQPRQRTPEKSTAQTAAAVWNTVKTGAAAGFSKASAFVTGIFKKPEEEDEDTEPAPARSGAKHAGGLAARLRISDWGEAEWKRAQRICLIVCLVLVVIIIVIVASGRSSSKTEEAEPTPTIPAAATAEPVPTATPEPVLYPDETVRAAIESASASLDIKPEDTDYVTEPTTATVKTNGSVLNMRRGTSSNYGQIGTIPNGTSVDVYAYKSNWALVQYNGTYGWCSTEYLK